MRAPSWKLALASCALGFALGPAGCGGPNPDSEIAATAGPPPADAPKSAAEYDAKFPVPNAGDRAKAKGRGPAVTNP